MRLSVLMGDPGFDPIKTKQATIYLDGVPQRHVVTADEEQGAIMQYIVDNTGKPKTADDGKSFEVVVRVGKVQIEFEGDGNAA